MSHESNTVRPTSEERPDLLKPQEAAPLLRVHYKTVLRLCREGKLRAVRFGSRNYKIPREAIAECIERMQIIGTEAGTGEREETVPSVSQPVRLAPVKRANSAGGSYKQGWYERFR